MGRVREAGAISVGKCAEAAFAARLQTLNACRHATVLLKYVDYTH